MMKFWVDSAETLMRITPGDRDDIYDEEGTVAIWQWLSLRRFFPLDKEWVGKPMIGCSSVSSLNCFRLKIKWCI